MLPINIEKDRQYVFMKHLLRSDYIGEFNNRINEMNSSESIEDLIMHDVQITHGGDMAVVLMSYKLIRGIK